MVQRTWNEKLSLVENPLFKLQVIFYYVSIVNYLIK